MSWKGCKSVAHILTSTAATALHHSARATFLKQSYRRSSFGMAELHRRLNIKIIEKSEAIVKYYTFCAMSKQTKAAKATEQSDMVKTKSKHSKTAKSKSRPDAEAPLAKSSSLLASEKNVDSKLSSLFAPQVCNSDYYSQEASIDLATSLNALQTNLQS